MLVTRTSAASGIERTIDIPVTEQQMLSWENGELIQVAMPNLTADEREFLLTGMWGDEWDKMFSD